MPELLPEPDINRIAEALARKLRADGLMLVPAVDKDPLPAAMNRSEAARRLGIDRRTLFERIRKGKVKCLPDGRIPAREIRRLETAS
ncbi:MAG: helix-turn-helix domain-containing protein [Verrucomicrobiota bacterium JB024]|nr:helix-turn-helix domain-containing protein [Verrucomicrobiota bacterium JB024]